MTRSVTRRTPAPGQTGWWIQFFSSTSNYQNMQDRPWAECELVWVSDHVLEGRPLKELTQAQLHDPGRNLMIGARSSWRETHELPPGAPRWKAKQVVQTKTKAPKAAAFFGCCDDEEAAGADAD